MRLYKIAMTLIAAALLIVQAAAIWHGGAFTREIVGEKLSRIAPALILWLILAAVGMFIPKSRAKNAKQEKVSQKQSAPKHLNKIRIAIAAVAAALILAGIFNGGMRDVFVKAINICTECSGLG